MKYKALLLTVLLAIPLLAADSIISSPEKSPMWDGKTRGMELVTIGHKKVTIYLADGRTAVLGIPILVERPLPVYPGKARTR
jgi:hypothetical protein